MPGRISPDRHVRDTQTCKRLDRFTQRGSGFLFEISRDCDTALSQILNHQTNLATFDVARAYLDGLHDYANALDFLSTQKDDASIASDFGAYLIGQQTGLIGQMHDWRQENRIKQHPELYVPTKNIMT